LSPVPGARTAVQTLSETFGQAVEAAVPKAARQGRQEPC
jgi:hypothetical protein